MSIRNTSHRINPAALACFILFLAFVLRIAYWRDQWNAPLAIVGDEVGYYSGGVTLARGSQDFWRSDDWHGWHYIVLLPPGYYVGLAGLIHVLGEDPLALRLFQVVEGTLTVALVYRLGRSLFDRHVGVGAALLVALWQPFVDLPVLLMTENLFIPLLLATLLCLVEFERLAPRHKPALRPLSGHVRGLVLLFAAGFLFAAATLTRSMTSLLFVLVPLWLFFICQFKWRAAALSFAVFLLGSALLFAPWTLRNYSLYDRLLLTDTQGGRNLAWANGGISDDELALIPNPVDRQSIAMRSGLESILSHPAALAERILPNVRHILRLEETNHLLVNGDDGLDTRAVVSLLSDDLIWLLVVLFAIVGFVFAEDWRKSSLLLLLVGCTLALLVVVFVGSVRYRWPLMPLLAPYAAFGVRVVWTRRFRSFPALRAGLALSVCALVLAFVGWEYPARIWQVTARELALANGTADVRREDLQSAAHELQVAGEIDPDSIRVQLARGDLYRASGDLVQAVAAYKQVVDMHGDSLAGQVRLGDAFRVTGQNDSAAALLEGEGDADNRLLDWAWDHPEAVSGSPSRVDVGRLDAGFVQGMLSSQRVVDENGEWNYRWTTAIAQVRLFPSTAGPRVLSMRLNALRPEGAAQPYLTVQVNGRQLARLLVRRIWWVYNLRVPAELSSPLVVTLLSDVWIPGGRKEYEPPIRYGVEVNWIQVGPAPIPQ